MKTNDLMTNVNHIASDVYNDCDSYTLSPVAGIKPLVLFERSGALGGTMDFTLLLAANPLPKDKGLSRPRKSLHVC